MSERGSSCDDGSSSEEEMNERGSSDNNRSSSEEEEMTEHDEVEVVGVRKDAKKRSNAKGALEKEEAELREFMTEMLNRNSSVP